MARYKAKAFVEGKETEVELDDAQYIAREQHDTVLSETVQKRLERQAKNLRDSLANDDEFVNGIFKARGIDPNAKPGKGGASAEEIEKLQAEWRKQHVDPLTADLEAARKRAETVTQRTLVAELTTALVNAGVEKGIAPRIAQMEAGRFGYDDKSGQFAVREGDEFAFSTKATKDRPYKGIDEFADEWTKDKANTPFIVRQSQSGPGLGGEPRGGAPTVRSRADFKTVAEKSAFIAEHGYEAFTKLPEK